MLFVTVCTGIDVSRARIWLKALSRDGSRCGTKTNDMTRFGESARRNAVNASSPPAEAPIPTIGNPGFCSALRDDCCGEDCFSALDSSKVFDPLFCLGFVFIDSAPAILGISAGR